MSVLMDVADALTTLINTGSYSESFTAVRRLLPEYRTSALNNLLVSVIPIGRDIELQDRATRDNSVVINIGIQKKVDNDTTDVEDLMDLTDEIIEHIHNETLTGVAALWTRTNVEIPYDVDSLHEGPIFLSVLAVTYKVFT